MIVFLTSSPSGPLDVPNYDKLLDEKNGFVENLRQFWKEEMRGMIIAAAPDSFEGNVPRLPWNRLHFGFQNP